MNNKLIIQSILAGIALHLCLILPFLLVGCGSSSGGKGAVAEEPKTAPSKEDEKEEVSEIQSANDKVTALAVSELPECNSSNLKQLVVLIADKKFYTCEESGWEEFEITQNTTTTVVNNTYSQLSIWEDPNTGKFWFVKAYASAYDGCPDSGSNSVADSWKSATPAETIEAINNGLFGDANVKVYTLGNKFVHTADTSIVYTASDYTGSVSAFTVCVSY